MMDMTDAIYAISVGEYSGEGSSPSCNNLVKNTIYSKKEWTLSRKNETLIGDNIVYFFVTLNNPGTPEYHIVPSKVDVWQISETHRLWLQYPGKKGRNTMTILYGSSVTQTIFGSTDGMCPRE